MSIRPSPHTYTCPACHWSKTVAPRSDALMPGEYFDACPMCGHTPLTTHSANAAWVTLEKSSSQNSALAALIKRAPIMAVGQRIKRTW